MKLGLSPPGAASAVELHYGKCRIPCGSQPGRCDLCLGVGDTFPRQRLSYGQKVWSFKGEGMYHAGEDAIELHCGKCRRQVFLKLKSNQGPKVRLAPTLLH